MIDSRFVPSRRAVVAGGVALLGAPAILRAQGLVPANPFTLGVAAGEPAPDGFVIWTRLAPDPLAEHGGMKMNGPVPVDWEVAEDERFTRLAGKGSATAWPDLAHSIRVEVPGLRPDRVYWYRFTTGRDQSPVGRARTLPLPGAALDRLRFGVVGCQNYEDGYFTAYRHIADEDVAFVFHYGDYIYESGGKPAEPPTPHDPKWRPAVRPHAGQKLFSLDDYRRRYAQYRMDTDLQASHHAAAWFPVFDDHEVENNWAGDIDQENDPPEVFAFRKRAAFQAYFEHMPFRKASYPGPDGMHIYRRAQVGTLMDLHLLDTRQFRTDQPCGDNFKPICAGVADPAARMMSADEERWLYAALAEKRARWHAIAQQVMIMPIDRRIHDEPAAIRNMDSWGGYDAPRERLLANLRGLGNAVVLTGDEHQNFAGELRTNGGQGDAVAVEFVSTSISSGGDGADKRAGNDKIMAGNPFLKWTNDRRGYVTCDVTPDVWTTHYRVVERVSVPGAPVTTAATVTVPHGRPELSIA